LKFGNLKSFAHNIADSLASGCSFMVDYRAVDVFEEAMASEDGYIEIDFLTGDTRGAPVSSELGDTIVAFRDSLPEHAAKNSVDLNLVSKIDVRFGTRQGIGPRIRVTVADTTGRESADWYYGWPARRLDRSSGARPS
jgi:hypothetical protein